MPIGIYERTEYHRKALRVKKSPRSEEHSKKISERNKGMIPWNKGLRGFKSGEEAPQWKGENAGYGAKHDWVRKLKGYAAFCVDCKKKGGYFTRKNGSKVWNIDWSNISGKYMRDLKDYTGRCRSCHMKYDEQHYKMWVTRRVMK